MHANLRSCVWGAGQQMLTQVALCPLGALLHSRDGTHQIPIFSAPRWNLFILKPEHPGEARDLTRGKIRSEKGSLCKNKWTGCENRIQWQLMSTIWPQSTSSRWPKERVLPLCGMTASWTVTLSVWSISGNVNMLFPSGMLWAEQISSFRFRKISKYIGTGMKLD